MNRGKREAMILAVLQRGSQPAAEIVEQVIHELADPREILPTLRSMARRRLVEGFYPAKGSLKFWKALMLALVLAPTAGAIVNGYEPKELDAVATLGRPNEPWHCSAVLVAPAIAMTARHCWGVVGWTGEFEVGFRTGHRARVIAWHVSTTDDIALVYLEAPVPDILPLPVLMQEPTKPIESVLAGWGMEGPGLGEGDATRLLACDSELRPGSGIAYLSAWDASGPGCGPNTKDSGGAVLAHYRSRLMVVGVILASTWGAPTWLQAGDPVFAALAVGDF